MAANRSRAPEFPAGPEWFNVDSPVILAEQTGRVVLIYFGAWSSGHRPHSLSDLQYLSRNYRDDLIIIVPEIGHLLTETLYRYIGGRIPVFSKTVVDQYGTPRRMFTSGYFLLGKRSSREGKKIQQENGKRKNCLHEFILTGRPWQTDEPNSFQRGPRTNHLPQTLSMSNYHMIVSCLIE